MLHPLESGGGGTAGRIGNGVGRACVGAGRCWRRSLCWGGLSRCRSVPESGGSGTGGRVGAGRCWSRVGEEGLRASWWPTGGFLVASCLLVASWGPPGGLLPPKASSSSVCVLKTAPFLNSATKCNEVRVALSNVMRRKTKAHCKAHGNDLKVSE